MKLTISSKGSFNVTTSITTGTVDFLSRLTVVAGTYDFELSGGALDADLGNVG